MKFGLVLSGGGMKGIAHIGVLKALNEYGIEPQIITGTSYGAIIAGLYVSGLSYEKIYDFLFNVDLSIIDIDFFGILKSLLHFNFPDGLIKGDKILQQLKILTNNKNINEIIDKKIAIVSTNITNGKDVIFSNEDIKFKNKETINDFLLCEAIRASMSYPIVFKPFIKNNNVFIDGGIVDNCPTCLCSELGADFVLISNMSFVDENFNKYNNGFNILSQIISIFVQQAYEDDINLSLLNSFTLKLNLKQFKIGIISFNKEKLKQAFDYGYESTIEFLKESKIDELL